MFLASGDMIVHAETLNESSKIKWSKTSWDSTEFSKAIGYKIYTKKKNQFHFHIPSMNMGTYIVWVVIA